MVYVDTSVLVAYYCPEPLSENVEAFLTTHAQPTISALTEIELFSAVSLPLRTFDALHLAISSSEGFDIVTADPGLFKSAKALSLNAILLE